VDEQPPRSGEVHLGRDDGGFTDVTHASGLRPRATAFDADGDGDRDVYTVAGGLALQRGAPDTWLRVHPRQAASDRLASGAWITVRDGDGRVVASGTAEAGVVALGLPDPDARYAVTVRFPGGASRTIADVPARSDLVVDDLDGLAGGLARMRLWATGTWLRIVAVRDLLAPLLALALTLALARLRPRPWLPTFAGLALAGLPLWLGFTVRGPATLAWLLAPLDLAAAALLTALIAAVTSARRRVRVGPFRLRERLGAGAAGTVWRAERDGEDLALKLYEVDVMESADARERFFREARIGAEIQHPNLVQIVDAGRLDDGRCYLVMKRIDGASLATRLTVGPRLPVASVVQIGIDIAGALAALHAADVVHRDVKPANIVLRRDGRAVLTDLGLARSALFRTVTRLDVAVGTLAYMSPEQAIGRPIDGRADLWSLGVVLYELLTDRRPFSGQHEMELIYLLCNVDPPDLQAQDPTIPGDLAAIVMRCLAREPQARHADAAALEAALAQVGRRLAAHT
jgi:tRNA A-37 threonylcarbamoyl transferase component Bud32